MRSSQTWTASASIGGKKVSKKGKKLGELKLGPKTEDARASAAVCRRAVFGSGRSLALAASRRRLSIAPGETIAATLKVERNGFDGEIKFGGELSGRNLPHGVYVDNIGLNGVTLLQGENERTIFLTARKWVPEQSRLFHLQADTDGKQTSWPVLLHVATRADAAPPATKSVALRRRRTSWRVTEGSGISFARKLSKKYRSLPIPDANIPLGKILVTLMRRASGLRVSPLCRWRRRLHRRAADVTGASLRGRLRRRCAANWALRAAGGDSV